MQKTLKLTTVEWLEEIGSHVPPNLRVRAAFGADELEIFGAV